MNSLFFFFFFYSASQGTFQGGGKSSQSYSASYSHSQCGDMSGKSTLCKDVIISGLHLPQWLQCIWSEKSFVVWIGQHFQVHGPGSEKPHYSVAEESGVKIQQDLLFPLPKYKIQFINFMGWEILFVYWNSKKTQF